MGKINRTERLDVRLTPADKEFLRVLAKARQCTVTSLLEAWIAELRGKPLPWEK